MSQQTIAEVTGMKWSQVVMLRFKCDDILSTLGTMFVILRNFNLFYVLRP